MATIARIWAREILDSRSIPTIEAACQLSTGHIAVTSVPSGAYSSAYEGMELRDNDPARYFGKGVLKAVDNVNKVLGPLIVGYDPMDQVKIDKKLLELDGTENKSKLGVNSILSVSQVVTKAGAMVANTSLYAWVNYLAKQHGLDVKMRIPTPVFNMINGGLHGAGNLDFQEFFVIPATSKAFADGLRMGSEIYTSIGENLSHRGAIHSVGDEGGYAPNLFTNADALEILVETIRQSPYSIGRDMFLGLDVAASTFFKDGMYMIRDKSAPLTEDALVEYYKEINDQYHLAILEDPLHEDAWAGWKKITEQLGGQLTVVGDDLLATNTKRLDRAIAEKACGGILIKHNQTGTVTETLDIIKKARSAKWKVICSHRSGETNDWFMADFSVGVGSDYVKFGAPARGERVAKYNRLSSIEMELSVAAK